MEWPCRLLEVTSPHTVTPDPIGLPSKRAGVEFVVVRELDPLLALGPQGEHVVALIEATGRLTLDQADHLYAAASLAWSAAWYAARDAARALMVRDLIPTERYDALTRLWRTIVGPIHPDDPNLT